MSNYPPINAYVREQMALAKAARRKCAKSGIHKGVVCTCVDSDLILRAERDAAK